MKPAIYLLFIIASLFLLPANATDMPHDTITVFSLNHAVQQGAYEGVTTVGNLHHYGDLGIGTEAELASELVLLDGVCYGIAADGVARRLDDATPVAFAVVKKFEHDTLIHVREKLSLDQLKDLLRHRMQKNRLAAIRIQVRCASVTYRSYVKQEPPYKPISKAREKLFTRRQAEGTMIGFYTPASLAAVNTPEFHFHFLTQDRSSGGHVKAMDIEEAYIAVEYAKALHIQLPGSGFSDKVDLEKRAKVQK